MDKKSTEKHAELNLDVGIIWIDVALTGVGPVFSP